MENGEISVIASSIKSNTITALRSQAQEMGLFDPDFHVNFYKSTAQEKEVWDQNGSLKNSQQTSRERYKIYIPSIASKQDLLDLKSFLHETSTPQISVLLDIQWQEIDTKLFWDSLESLTHWVNNRWKGVKIVRG